MWHYGWHPFLCVFSSQRIPLSVLARNPHKGFVREISHETGSEGGKEGPREGHSQQKGAEEDSRQERAVKRRSVRKWESGREETSQQKSAWLVALWEFSLEYTLALAHRMHKTWHRLPPLALGANLSPIVCSSFPLPSRLRFVYP